MPNMELWLTPLLLLPGVALPVLSTSSRYGRIHDEIHHLHESDESINKLVASNLLHRSRLFKNSLVSLYICIALFSTAGLLGGIESVWIHDYHLIVIAISGVGIFFLLYASILLIKESSLSLEIIEAHYKRLMKEDIK